MTANADHLSSTLCQAYLEGWLDTHSIDAIDAHVDRCPGCARLLQQAALREEALYVAAAALKQRPRMSPATRHAFSVGAMAASVLMMLSAEPMPQRTAPSGVHRPVAAVMDTNTRFDACSISTAYEREAGCDSALLASFPEDEYAAQDTNVCMVTENEALVCSLDEPT